MPTLYIVATPIGNLEDVTLRALAVLRTVDRVLAEDTRRTAVLLNRYEIRVPLVSLHEHNEAARAERVLGWLRAGEDLALVSDAGTPLLSDPGERLVSDVVAAGFAVVPLPGASALLAAVVAAGLPTGVFTFWGFPPRSGGERATLLARVLACEHTGVIYESPNRLARLLSDLASRGAGERRVVVARELTKVHEEFRRGTVAELAAYYGDSPEVRGEVVLVLEGGSPAEPDPAAAEALARELLASGLSPSAAARELARRLQLRRNQAYQVVHSVGET
jgi:16S rRNA (cytidine1402-2'-O)-methyltransferase